MTSDAQPLVTLLRAVVAAQITGTRDFRHYKGGTYTLLCCARLSEEHHQEVAVYISHQLGSVWVRPWVMFHERVQWADGVMRPRFTPLDEIATSVLMSNSKGTP
jgi:hypothetical protein